MNTTTPATVQALAVAFATEIRKDLTADELTTAIAANRNEPNPSICHTHDYCDANMTMLAAFERVVGRPIDLQSDEDTALWSAAWSEWKRLSVATITMRAFFALPAVIALQETQKRHAYGSPEHRKAFEDMKAIAATYGADLGDY